MNNLNKYSKAELISKFKRLDNQNSNQNQSIFTKIFSYILLFKNLILKITLITFIIKWIKKYSLIRRIWQVISSIASTLLGISFIDIYGFDLISSIRETQIYKWFSELMVTPKVVDKTSANDSIPSYMRQTDQNTTRSESDYEIIKRFKEIIKEIINKDSEALIEQEELNTPFYKNKYFILGVLSISVFVSWYYLDEIKTGYGSIIDWLNSFRRGPSGDTSGSSTNNSTTPITKNIQSELDRIFPENPQSDIELIDKGKGKTILTSPSLESLNNKAEEAWNDSSTSAISPESDSSSSTVTPQSFNKDIIKDMWKFMLQEDIKKDISFIEKTFDSNNELTKETADKLIKKLVNVVAEYDSQIELLNSIHTKNWSLNEINQYKTSLYYLRKWISKYHAMINPNEQILEIGNIIDDPIKISDQFFKA
jgi:hypothetical protein